MRKKLVLSLLITVLAIGAVLLVVLFLFWEQPGFLPDFEPIPMPDLKQVHAPEGAQLLIFPMENGAITAGYRNRAYYEKHGYPHYGIDITAANARQAQVWAAGSGVVLGTESCDNNLGNIAVIRHDNVFIPQTGETMTLIGRYYHMTQLFIQEGDTVAAGQVIGIIDRDHEWLHHIHLELDADVDYPFHTPQVAETSSQLLHRYPADGESMLDPTWVLAVTEGQRIYVHPGSKLCTGKDNPQFAAPPVDATEDTKLLPTFQSLVHTAWRNREA